MRFATRRDKLTKLHLMQTQQSGGPAGVNTGQGAFSRTVGLPPEAGTAEDASGTGAAHNTPYDASTGIAKSSLVLNLLMQIK